MSPVQSRCGCAFSSVGRPCVAQRVWPMPYGPSIGFTRMASSRLRSLPDARRTDKMIVAVQDRDSRRIIPAVFQPAQAIQNDGDRFSVPDIADDATHIIQDTGNGGERKY